MRCRTCDYRLWNLLERRCPECGTPFLPSQYEFFPNTIRFRCPHCDQSYYGTGEKGHLDPAEFDCVSCGRRIDMDQTVLEPTAGVDEDQTQTERVPWLERSHGTGVSLEVLLRRESRRSRFVDKRGDIVPRRIHALGPEGASECNPMKGCLRPGRYNVRVCRFR